MKSKTNLLIFILFPLAVGSLSSLLSRNMADQIFTQSPLTPPPYLFPIVWTILYILMGISSYIIYISNNHYKEAALRTYIIQLLFNFFWSIIFFGVSQYLFAFIWLIILIVLIIIMIWQFYKLNPIAAYLQIPYLLWCIFAAYLTFMVYKLN